MYVHPVLKASSSMTKYKILIVEDEPAIAKYISNTLQSDRYEVTALAFSSKRALQELNSNPPDLVLLDINLESELDGIQIGDIINKQFHIPFLFLTSYSDQATVDRAKHTRPLGYLVKPFSEKDILTTLEIALFNFSHQKTTPTLSLELINGNIVNPITTREFDILKGVYEGKGNQQLADDNFVSINTIKTHVRNLFSKIDVQSRTELIAQIRKLIS